MIKLSLLNALGINARDVPEWAKGLDNDRFVEFYDLSEEQGKGYGFTENWLKENGYEFVLSDPSSGSEVYAKPPKV